MSSSETADLCPWCRGVGMVPQMDDGDVACPVCRGKGRKTTMPGEQSARPDDSDHMCVTCQKMGGACRWTDDPVMCMRGQIDRLRSALQAVKGAIEQHAGDTLWMPSACPETACDFIDAALGGSNNAR